MGFCPSNQLTNGRFDEDIAGWNAAFVSANTIQHDEFDRADSANSGSMLSTSTRALNQRDPIAQCIPMAAGVKVSAAAEAWIQASNTDAGDVRLTLIFYSEPDCGGSFVETAQTALHSDQGQWQGLAVNAVSL